MRARTYWSGLTLGMAAAFIAREVPEIAKATPEEVGTYSVWWRRMLGLEPWHWRCLILAPAFGLFWTWFQIHILFDAGPRIDTLKRWFRRALR